MVLVLSDDSCANTVFDDHGGFFTVLVIVLTIVMKVLAISIVVLVLVD
jgi:hypothetical protein